MSIAGRTLARPRHADDEMFERVRAKLARFARDAVRQVRLARPLLPDELGDRAQDNWEPLLAIAQVAGEAWLQRATVAALTLSGASDATPSTGNELLADIQEVFERKQVSKISTADLIKALVADDERPWATYNRGHEISPRQVAKQLAAYGIKSKTVRLGAHNTPKDTSRRNSPMRSPGISAPRAMGRRRLPIRGTQIATAWMSHPWRRSLRRRQARTVRQRSPRQTRPMTISCPLPLQAPCDGEKITFSSRWPDASDGRVRASTSASAMVAKRHQNEWLDIGNWHCAAAVRRVSRTNHQRNSTGNTPH